MSRLADWHMFPDIAEALIRAPLSWPSNLQHFAIHQLIIFSLRAVEVRQLKAVSRWLVLTGNTVDKAKTKVISREEGYHGVTLAAMSATGLSPYWPLFEPRVPGFSHIPSPYPYRYEGRDHQSQGLSAADELEQAILREGAETIAMFIAEPVQGAGGVIVPQDDYFPRIREICDHYKVLLVADEVITGFGRLGDPFAAQHFNVEPDLITCAKGLTSGTVPMGAVIVKKEIYDAFQQGDQKVIDLFHGYTYSAHPLASAAMIAALDVYVNDGLFDHANTLSQYWEEMCHSLNGTDHIIDIRNSGLVAGIEMSPRDEKPGARGYDIFTDAFHNYNLLIRITGDTIALSPPLIAEKEHIDIIIETLRTIIPNH